MKRTPIIVPTIRGDETHRKEKTYQRTISMIIETFKSNDTKKYQYFNKLSKRKT